MSTRIFPAGRRPRRIEHRHTFACFGGECTVIVADAARPGDAAAAALAARDSLLQWHERFSRFLPDSELSRLNRSGDERVRVSPLMGRMISLALHGARATGGLVDPTLAAEIERAGYAGHLEAGGISLAAALCAAPPRSPAGPHPRERWRQVTVDPHEGTVSRPPGVRIDVGGIAKGAFADELSALLAGFDAFAVDCAGDLRLGGRARVLRDVQIAHPFHPGIVHALPLVSGGVATSGIGRRSWAAAGGATAHHLLDPRTGAPAFTGIVQATALAPTAAQAEILAKAALLSGPQRAAQWLAHGGVIVFDDGRHEVVGPRSAAPMSARPPAVAGMSSRTGPARISWTAGSG